MRRQTLKRKATPDGSSRPALAQVLARVRDPTSARPDPSAAEELDAEISRHYRRDRVVYLTLLLGIGAIWIVAWSFEFPGGSIPVSIVVILSAAYSWFQHFGHVVTAVEPECASSEMLGGTRPESSEFCCKKRTRRFAGTRTPFSCPHCSLSNRRTETLQPS